MGAGGMGEVTISFATSRAGFPSWWAFWSRYNNTFRQGPSLAHSKLLYGGIIIYYDESDSLEYKITRIKTRIKTPGFTGK